MYCLAKNSARGTLEQSNPRAPWYSTLNPDRNLSRRGRKGEQPMSVLAYGKKILLHKKDFINLMRSFDTSPVDDMC